MDLFNLDRCGLNRAGCNLNRNVEAAMSSAGFTLVEVTSFQLFCDAFPPAYPYESIRAVRGNPGITVYYAPRPRFSGLVWR